MKLRRTRGSCSLNGCEHPQQFRQEYLRSLLHPKSAIDQDNSFQSASMQSPENPRDGVGAIETTRKSQSFVRFSDPKVSTGISTESPANSSRLVEYYRTLKSYQTRLRANIQGRATTESGIPRPQLRYNARL